MPKEPLPRTPKVFMDSSSLFAGVASRSGASRAILTLAEIGLLRIVVCQQVLDETRRNLQGKAPEAIPYFEQITSALNLEIVDYPSAEDVAKCKGMIRHVDDAPILAAAINAAPDRLITLDIRHFIDDPRVARESGLVIQTPSQFMVEIRGFLARGYEKE
ncbi:MAG: PIN domain-containing protein [Chloroflexota bacterium]|nr:PIN domain-containing protein [Chloroflexota bacterium]